MYLPRIVVLISAALLAACGDNPATCGTPGSCTTSARDTAAPVAQISSHQDPGFVREALATVTGTLSDDVGVARATYAVNGGAEQALAVTPGPQAAFALQLPVSDAQFTTVTVHAYDAAGNRGSTAPLRMARDSTPPTLSITSPAPGGVYHDVAGAWPNVMVGGIAEGAVAASYSLNGGPEMALEYGPSSCQFKCFRGPAAPAQPGENVLVVHARDGVGNRVSGEVRFVWQLLPRVEVTAPAATTDAGVRLEGTATHPDGVARVTYAVNGGAEQDLGAAAGPAASFSATVPLREGPNQVAFYAYTPGGVRGADTVQVARSLSPGTPGAFSQVSAGARHGCGLAGGTLYCWGSLAAGWNDIRLQPLPGAVAGSFSRVAAGNGYTCALAQGGAAHCWGLGENGRLGDGTGASRAAPTPVAGGLAFASLAVEASHACGVTAQGAGYCWGAGADGRLGSGTQADQLAPAVVAGGHAFSSIEVGLMHSCGLTTSGSVYCWGSNADGQLGNGSFTGAAIPVPVSGGHTFTALAAGGISTCALNAAGAAFCWGALRPGGIDAGPPAPVTGGLVFQALAMGSDFACGLTTGGAAYCWGRNSRGQLGNGAISQEWSYTPAAVAGWLEFTAITAGDQHACGVLANGAAYCWGAGDFAQLGTGTTVSSSVPVRVTDPH